MFKTYNYFRQYNDNLEIKDYKSFYKKFSNEREFGGDFTHYDHLVKGRFFNILGHIYNIILRKQPANILDIGCGNGINLPLANIFPSIDYNGLDYAEKTIEKASANYPNVKFHVGDAFNMAFADKSFDMTILSSVLILYEDKGTRKALLKEVSRVLKDDGVFVLIVWNQSPLLCFSIWLSRIIGRLTGQKLPEDFMGIHFKYNEIKNLTEESGLKIEECINTSSLYGVLESVRYLNLSKYNRKFGKQESEASQIKPQNILKDLQKQAGGTKWLTSFFYMLSKINPDFFNMFSVYVLSKN